MRNKTFIIRALSIIGLLFFSLSAAIAQAPAAAAIDGKALFLGKCASCHNPNMKQKSTGPALGGVTGRWPNKVNLHSWIRNSTAFLATGDTYANALYKEFNGSNMSQFPALTDPEIDAILSYIEVKASAPVTVATTGGAATTGGGAATEETTSVYTYLMYSLFFTLLLSLAFILARTIANLNAVAVERETGVAVAKPTFKDIIFRKPIVAMMIFFGIVMVGYTTVSEAVNTGRQQGYAPDQPIKFSHAIHAGKNKIDCQYCHDGARRGKHASIPGASTCMNCHMAIQQGPKYGKVEIAKIYASAGYNPDKQVYDKEKKPIEWTRIHNLPDHVYFNHSQHVVAGKIKCQQCHGKVEEMELVQQHAPLSMGWCINCHRKTEVQFKDNKYYEAYQLYHDELKTGKRKGVTVEDIGGLECQKCHY